MTFFGVHRRVPVRTEYRCQTDDIIALTGVAGPAGPTQIFGLDEQGAAWVIGNNLSVDNFALTGCSTKLVCLRAGIHAHDSVNLLEVFAIGADNKLYHARQVVDETGTLAWSQFVSLGGPLFASPDALAVCSSGTGMSQCFAVTTEGHLVWFTQNQDLEWEMRTVAVAHQGQLEEFASYSTEVSLVDQYGTPMPATPLLAYTSVEARVILNGRVHATGPHNPIACTTNAAGRITVVVPTLSIGTPSLIIDGGALEDGYVLNIHPDKGTQEKIDGQTWSDVETTLTDAAKSGALPIPQNILDDGDTMEGVSKAILNSFSLAQQDEGYFDKWQKAADARGDIRGVRVLSRATAFDQADAIDARRVPEQHWHLRFTEGGLVYTALRDRAEATALIAQLSSGGADFDLSLRPDWGTLWRGVRHGATVLTDMVVTTLTEIAEDSKSYVSRIEAYIATKAGQVYNYVVDKVQMAFDIVQGVFEAIEVKFEALFQWLGTLFNWQDVLTVKTIVKSVIGQGLAAAPQQIEKVWSSVIDGLKEMESAGPPDVGKYGGTTLGQASQTANQDATGKAPGPSANFVQSQILDNGGGGPGAVGSAMKLDTAMSAMSAIFQFFQSVEQAAQNEISVIWEDFRQALLSGNSVAQLSLNDLLKAFKSEMLTLAVTVLDSALPLVKTLFDALDELINHKWEIPVLSQLYRKIDPATS